jgi:large subunit ribosomal protein L21
MLGGNGDVSVGTPTVDGANVVAEIVEHGRGEKIIVFKYKNKTRYRRRQGHRQDFTKIAIKEITLGGKTLAAEETKPKAKKSRASRAVAVEEPEAADEAKIEAEALAEAEAPVKPTRAKKAAPKPKAGATTTDEAEATSDIAVEASTEAVAEAPKKRTRASKPKAEATTKPKPATKTKFVAKKPKAETTETTAEEEKSDGT